MRHDPRLVRPTRAALAMPPAASLPIGPVAAVATLSLACWLGLARAAGLL